MPVVVKPKPPAPTPHGVVRSAGKQEDFFAAGNELAARLGWDGAPDLIGNDITVEDARGFLIKTLHEYFIAGATSEERPDPKLAAEHLGLSDAADLDVISAALGGAFESGKGAEVTHHPIVHAVVGASTTLQISKALDAAASAGKAG